MPSEYPSTTGSALLVLGFPLALGLAWSFDVTSGGIRRTGASEGSDKSSPVRSAAYRLAGAVGLAAALAFGGYHLLSQPSEAGREDVSAAVPEAGQSIAVLPLRNLARS